jgi:chromosome segregation protein
MKLAHLRLCGFRGYRAPVEIRFESGFTIVDGRNGVGKSTLCDADEFALTGSISKYRRLEG